MNKNKSGLSQEQIELVKRASTLESAEYLKHIAEEITEGKDVSVTVSEGKESDNYKFKVNH